MESLKFPFPFPSFYSLLHYIMTFSITIFQSHVLCKNKNNKHEGNSETGVEVNRQMNETNLHLKKFSPLKAVNIHTSHKPSQESASVTQQRWVSSVGMPLGPQLPILSGGGMQPSGAGFSLLILLSCSYL